MRGFYFPVIILTVATSLFVYSYIMKTKSNKNVVEAVRKFVAGIKQGIKEAKKIKVLYAE